MSSVIRLGLSQINSTGIKLLITSTPSQFVRNISGKALRAQRPSLPKPAPWPYCQKRYTIFNYLFDRTSARLDENSKIVVVEGPIAAGKTKFAQRLAEELDMLYLPEANQDMYYINDRGYDLRQLDPLMPESCRTFDVNDFMVNPRHPLSASLQLRQYIVKYDQYIDALAHLLSTGQGIVLDRCVYSDFVFTEAMVSRGFMSKGAKSVYYDLRKNTIVELLRPHLVIYLDVPPKKILEKVSKRSISYEKDSPVLTEEYLKDMEHAYKQTYLKAISEHANLLVYDWSEEGDVEIVVEDIERLNFERENTYDPKFKDWAFPLEEDLAMARHIYADRKASLMSIVNGIARYDVPELLISGEDFKTYRDILMTAPGEYWEKGFDPELDGNGWIFKMSGEKRHTLPLRERRVPIS